MDTSVATEATTKHRALWRRAFGGAVAAVVAAAVVATGGLSGAKAASEAAKQAVAPVVAEAPGYAVEDFAYPGADKILAEQGITLKRGDGHIVLADCAGGGELVEVKAMPNVLDTVCFRVTGGSGWLSLEMPAVFSVKGNDYNTTVSMTTDGEDRTWDVDKNLWTSVGESDDEQGRQFALVEIRTSK
ncbi:hypothetical protein ACWC4D_03490 [Streptomyces sp. NPDC001288]|uniref:hypothetical protein n=1 Tax=unclassified Streptomyces TaxID=2593676 RepID=UPI00331989D7